MEMNRQTIAAHECRGKKNLKDRSRGVEMKKIRFQNFRDLKEVIAVLEKHDIEFTWDILNRYHEVHLGHANADHVKLALENCHVHYEIMDYD